MHTFCALKTQPKLPFCPYVKEMPKSSHHEDFGVSLTFGWFGYAFFVMSAQNSAILADPKSTISNQVLLVGYIKNPLATKTQNTKHKTQNTKTHNNQHEPSLPYPPATLHSTSMVRSEAPPMHGAMACYGPMPSARGLVWRRHHWLACLGGTKQQSRKIERKWCIGLKVAKT